MIVFFIVAQEWVEVIPTRKMNHPKVDEYFQFIDGEYVPIGTTPQAKDNKDVEVQKEESEKVSEELTTVVAELTNAHSKNME